MDFVLHTLVNLYKNKLKGDILHRLHSLAVAHGWTMMARGIPPLPVL